MKKRSVILLLILISVFRSNAQPALPQDSIVKNISEYAEKVMHQWKIPGMSLSVIRGDSVILSKGFGVKEKGKSIAENGPQVAVTPQTLFHIGSMTKAFTAALIASLADEGLVSWEDTVKHILPDFDWYDDEVEARMQVKDLVTHGTGLVAQVGTYIPNLGYDRDDIYKMFRYMEPVYPFREKFAYNNITFIIAAKVIEKVTGKSWETNIEERIFRPLGMNSSVTDAEGYLAAGKKSSTAHYFGYRKGKNGSRGSIYVTPLRGEERALHWVTQIGPAGSITSNAEDMARWVMFHMNSGSVTRPVFPDNIWLKPYPVTLHPVSEAQMEFLHTGIRNVKKDSTMTLDYAYCWYVEQNERYKVIFHTGTTWGFTGICGFVPELDLGFALLCNSEVSEYARKAIMRRIIDLHLPADSAGYRDWSSEGLEKWYANKKKGGRRAVPCIIERSRVTPDLASLVGTYHKEEPFGDATVSMKNGKLYLTIGKYGWKHRLDHHKGNEFWLRSDGHTFPIYFHHYNEPDTPTELEIDFNYNENFGPWIRK